MITVEDVKKLREMTGVGMLDCKNALAETDGDLDKAVDDLTLKDVIKIEAGSPLYKVRHTSIKDDDELFNSFKNKLTIKDIFGDDLKDYKFLNSIPENTTISGIGDAINDMKLIDAFDENIYDGPKDSQTAPLKSMWKYLLIEEGEDWIEADALDNNPTRGDNPFGIGTSSAYACTEYTLGGNGDGTPGHPKGIDQMMTNMKYWMENQKLKTLQKDGMIHIEGDLLISNIPSSIRAYDDSGIIPTGAEKYGDLTTKQFVELMTKVPFLTA